MVQESPELETYMIEGDADGVEVGYNTLITSDYSVIEKLLELGSTTFDNQRKIDTILKDANGKFFGYLEASGNLPKELVEWDITNESTKGSKGVVVTIDRVRTYTYEEHRECESPSEEAIKKLRLVGMDIANSYKEDGDEDIYNKVVDTIEKEVDIINNDSNVDVYEVNEEGTTYLYISNMELANAILKGKDESDFYSVVRNAYKGNKVLEIEATQDYLVWGKDY